MHSFEGQDKNATVVATGQTTDVPKTAQDEIKQQQDDEITSPSRLSGKQLFGGMVTEENNMIALKQKQREEKKKMIEKIKKDNYNVMPFVYKNSFIK